MAPPRQTRPLRPGRPVHLRLPDDVFERLEAKAKSEGRPINRMVIDELSRIPILEAQTQLAKIVRTMENVLARYGARIVTADLETQLLRALDRALAAESAGQLQAQLDALRVLRSAMLNREQAGLVGDSDLKWPVGAKAAPTGADGK